MIVNQSNTRSYTEQVTIDSFNVTDFSGKLENFSKVMLASNAKNNAVKFNAFSLHFRNPTEDKIEIVSVILKVGNEKINFELDNFTLDTDDFGKSTLKMYTSIHNNLNYRQIFPMIKKAESPFFFNENSSASLFIRKICLKLKSLATNTAYTYSCRVLLLFENSFETNNGALYPFITQAKRIATFRKFLNGKEIGSPFLKKKTITPPRFNQESSLANLEKPALNSMQKAQTPLEVNFFPNLSQRITHFSLPDLNLNDCFASQTIESTLNFETHLNQVLSDPFSQTHPKRNREFEKNPQNSPKKKKLDAVSETILHSSFESFGLNSNLTGAASMFPSAQKIENVNAIESPRSQMELDDELNLIFEKIGRYLESNDF